MIGYIRVSTIDQNTQRQLEGIQLGRVFEDKASGKDTKRPALKDLLQFVREGDTVIAHSMSELGVRSYIMTNELIGKSNHVRPDTNSF